MWCNPTKALLFRFQVFRFDPRHNSWLQVASMLDRRTRFHADVLNDRLVAVGGGALLGTLTNAAEEYWPAENEWRPITSFPMPVADHAGATHKGILYISGKRQQLLWQGIVLLSAVMSLEKAKVQAIPEWEGQLSGSILPSPLGQCSYPVNISCEILVLATEHMFCMDASVLIILGSRKDSEECRWVHLHSTQATSSRVIFTLFH